MSHLENAPPQQPADRWIDSAYANRHVLCRGLAGLTLPFRRYGGGREVEGRALALALLAGWTVLTHDLSCAAYSALWFVGVVVYALTTSRRVHSRWEGWPYLMGLVRSYRLAAFLEAPAVAGLGYALYEPAPALALVLLASAAGMWISSVTDWWHMRKELIAFRDADIEMRNRREAYRRVR